MINLDFRPLELDSKTLIQRYTLVSSRRNCDLSFANLFCWRFLYRTMYAVWGDFLLFRFWVGHHLAYMQPVYARPGGDDLCNGAEQDIWATLPLDTWLPVMQAMIADAEEQGHPFLLLGVSEGLRMQLERHFPGRFQMEANRDYADYIYVRDALETLAGKKLQPKRNHVNRFLREYPSFEYRELETGDASACLRLLGEWEAEREEDETLLAERRSITRALEHWEDLDLRGGTLWVDGRMVAFTYGAPVNADTFDVCVEKADASVEGAYAMINREFVRRLPSCFRYVNREEDLGIEGLRRAKLSYQPCCILPKYAVYEVNPQIPASVRMEVRKEQTRALWKSCFNDPEPFLDLYFSQKYTDEVNVTTVREGRVVSALQMLPYRMTCWGREVPVRYVSGACTHPDYRNRKLMRELLRLAHWRMSVMGSVFSLLIPAEPWLYAYYRQSGYESVCRAGYRSVEIQPLLERQPYGGYRDDFSVTCYRESLPGEEWKKLVQFTDETWHRRRFGILHDEDDLQVILADLWMAGGFVAVARQGEVWIGVAFCRPLEGILEVLDELYSGTPALEERFWSGMAVFAGCSWIRLPEEGGSEELAGQLRVINVCSALSLYAACHTDLHQVIKVYGDDAISCNNGYYQLEGGRCFRTDAAAADGTSCLTFALSELAAWLFQDENVRMSLMLN